MNELQTQLAAYLKHERVDEHRKYVERLASEQADDELRKLVCNRLTFGTAGLRGRMGPGFSQMNDLVIIQTSQGLASYLLEVYGTSTCSKRGIVLGHDARHNSARFAQLTALAFLQKNIPVYYCNEIVATPLIAFGVKTFNCLSGIMITASHNPKEDNGYKVYWANGAQILSPHDKYIQEHILQPDNQQPWPLAWHHKSIAKMQEADDKQLPSDMLSRLTMVYKDLSDRYFAQIEKIIKTNNERLPCSGDQTLRIAYTAMHGVGHKFLERALDLAGFGHCSYPVDEQRVPDPDFPTVKFPNPEEAGALELAFATASKTKSSLVLANDPDADRCAAAVYEVSKETRQTLTGNEIGAILGWWLWHSYTQSNPVELTSNQRKNCYMISTAVSSRFLKSMANKEGFQFIETLTGFKYMGNVADELIKEGKTVLFAFEEAIGYMCDQTILDKDGISAAIQLTQCAAYLANCHKRTLVDQLDVLYDTYGFHYSLNSYFSCSDQKIIRKIFGELQADYPKSFKSGDNEFDVDRVRDLNNGFDTLYSKPQLPVSSSSFMVTFFSYKHNIQFTIRTSGTEPKIKYYSEIVAPLDGVPNKLQAKEDARARLALFVELAIERCLNPHSYKLERAA